MLRKQTPTLPLPQGNLIGNVKWVNLYRMCLETFVLLKYEDKIDSLRFDFDPEALFLIFSPL